MREPGVTETSVSDRTLANPGDLGITVVVITRDRVTSLRHTLDELSRLRPCPEIVVVDNGSTDGTPGVVASEFPHVTMVALASNHGAMARNLGVAAARTELVAFADDDSSWAADALERAARIFRSFPDLGLLAARILVGAPGRVDPTCREMEQSPLGADRDGHARILGFLACGAVVRRRAFCDAGGFEELLFFLGEEETLALDLASAGWEMVYAPEVVAFHRPGTVARDTKARRRRMVRNQLISALIHHPWWVVMRRARGQLATGVRDADVRAGLFQAMGAAPRALLRRRPLPARVEAARRLLRTT